MARKKTPPPLFMVKNDFVESLDHFCQRAIMLHQAVKSALDLGQIGERVAPIVSERLKEFEKAMSSDGEP